MRISFISTNRKEEGFTIIETLIATAVFSAVLVVVTSAILQITNTYYKGITESNTQDAAKSIINDISQAIQFSNGDVLPTSSTATAPDTKYQFCVGTQRYSYQLGYEVEPNNPNASLYQTYHGLVVDQPSGGCQPGIPFPVTSSATSLTARDLLGQNMRLSNLSVVPYCANTQACNADDQFPGVFQIDVRVVYGDSDLLCSPSVGGSCQSNSIMPSAADFAEPDLTCKSSAGTQNCAVSELTTIVERRLQ